MYSHNSFFVIIISSEGKFDILPNIKNNKLLKSIVNIPKCP
jgi:hypothetical protein